MSFWDNVKKIAQPYSDEEYDDYEDEMEEFEEETREPAPRTRRSNPFGATQEASADYTAATPASSTGFSGQVLNMNSGKQEVVLFHAKTFDDAAVLIFADLRLDIILRLAQHGCELSGRKL